MRIFPMWLLLLTLAACNMDAIGLKLADGWSVRSVAVWRNARPDMLALSPSGKWLYVSCETNGGLTRPSLMAIRLSDGHRQMLLSGLMRADALKFAPDGSLWIGEEFPQGLIWRIAEPDTLPVEQKVLRQQLKTTHEAVAPFLPAGRFSHEGLSFSRDGRFAYLADENPRGGIYRLTLANRRLEVLDRGMHWRFVRNPDEAPIEARKLDAAVFRRIEDMETLPDGRIVMAETDTGNVLVLQDGATSAHISTLLRDARIAHPDNLAWDARRGLLWITDDSKPSALWVWNGHAAKRIALHKTAEITGVLPLDDAVYLNLQGGEKGFELTVKLTETESGR